MVRYPQDPEQFLRKVVLPGLFPDQWDLPTAGQLELLECFGKRLRTKVRGFARSGDSDGAVECRCRIGRLLLKLPQHRLRAAYWACTRRAFDGFERPWLELPWDRPREYWT